MQATVKTWGNSLAVRLPKHVVDELKLTDGASVAMEIDAGGLRITPTRLRLNLAELLAGEPKRAATDPSSPELDWGKPEGGEAW